MVSHAPQTTLSLFDPDNPGIVILEYGCAIRAEKSTDAYLVYPNLIFQARNFAEPRLEQGPGSISYHILLSWTVKKIFINFLFRILNAGLKAPRCSREGN